jgi:hypothetical protein
MMVPEIQNKNKTLESTDHESILFGVALGSYSRGFTPVTWSNMVATYGCNNMFTCRMSDHLPMVVFTQGQD